MNEATTGSLGSFLRRERERRGIALRAISEETKVSVSLLEGLEADDLSRWPGGIFRRAFVRGYATSVGLDPDEVIRRFEEQHKPPAPEAQEALAPQTPAAPAEADAPASAPAARRKLPRSPRRVRLLATAADLTVAVVLGLGSAAAGSRLLWPVLLIASYYALGSALTGRTPMTALLGEDAEDEELEKRTGAPPPKAVIRNAPREAAPAGLRRVRRQRRSVATEQRR